MVVAGHSILAIFHKNKVLKIPKNDFFQNKPYKINIFQNIYPLSTKFYLLDQKFSLLYFY